jgi:8-oxo-dGTP diphosphatase
MNKDIPTHAVKAVIKDEDGKILFLQRATDPAKKVVPNWDFPGGLVEAGEEDRIALRREIKEELGVDSIIGEELGTWTFFRPFDGNTVNVTNYSVQLTSRDITLSPEHVDLRWIESENAKKLPVKDQSLFGALGS